MEQRATLTTSFQEAPSSTNEPSQVSTSSVEMVSTSLAIILNETDMISFCKSMKTKLKGNPDDAWNMLNQIREAIREDVKDETLRKLFTRGLVTSIIDTMIKCKQQAAVENIGIDILLFLSQKNALIEDLIRENLPRKLNHLLNVPNHPCEQSVKDIFKNIEKEEKGFIEDCDDMSDEQKRWILEEKEPIVYKPKQKKSYEFARISNNNSHSLLDAQASMITAKNTMLHAENSLTDHHNLLLITNYFKSKVASYGSSATSQSTNLINAQEAWEDISEMRKRLTVKKPKKNIMQQLVPYQDYANFHKRLKDFYDKYQDVFLGKDEKLKEDMNVLIKRIKNNKLFADQEREKNDSTKVKRESTGLKSDIDDIGEKMTNYDDQDDSDSYLDHLGNEDDDDYQEEEDDMIGEQEDDEAITKEEEDDDNSLISERPRRSKRSRSQSNPNDSNCINKQDDSVAKRTRRKSSTPTKDSSYLIPSKEIPASSANKTTIEPQQKKPKQSRNLGELHIFFNIEAIDIEADEDTITQLDESTKSIDGLRLQREQKIMKMENDYLTHIKSMQTIYEEEIETLKDLQGNLSMSSDEMIAAATDTLKKLNEISKCKFTKEDLEKVKQWCDQATIIHQVREKIMRYHQEYMNANLNYNSMRTIFNGIKEAFEELYGICAGLSKEYQRVYDAYMLQDAIISEFNQAVKSNYEAWLNDFTSKGNSTY